MKDTFSDSDMILSKTNVGPKMCLRNCMMVNKCVAVNYMRKENKCVLLNNISSSDTLHHMDGFYYTEIQHWQMVGGFSLKET